MRIAATGFVSNQTGSIAAANGLLLKGLLKRGNEIDFFSKPSFVDPRPVVGESVGFHFIESTNHFGDGIRQVLQDVPGLGFPSGLLDGITYQACLQRRMTRQRQRRRSAGSQNDYDLVLWMGDYPRRRLGRLRQVGFVQGSPGTDARSILTRFREVRLMAGICNAVKFAVLARLRLSTLGLPPFRNADQLIVGSQQSKRTLMERYRIPGERVSTLPYPIDLDLFRLEAGDRRPEADSYGLQPSASSLKVLWLGRIVPRKRLDLFLDGASVAIRNGVDLKLTIVGGIGLVPGYEKLIAAFPFPDRLEWIQKLPRAEVPTWLHRHDLLCQPSDEEDFGSSVAEAQACGLPVIVGRTNGNADYLCARDTHLADDRPETLASVFADYAARKTRGGEAWGDPAESRALAEREFAVERVTERLLETLHAVARRVSV